MAAKSKIQKMKQSIKKRWVTALRSEKFKQGKGQLCQRYESSFVRDTKVYYDEEDVFQDNEIEYCCLGVLYNILNKKNNFVDLTLDEKTIKKVGLTNEIQERLAEYNDTGWSFKRIAAYIDRYL